jgi:hypothetical protein
MQLNELDTFRLSDAVHFHDELNPAVFTGDTMKSNVREQLLQIAEDFVEHLGIQNIDIDDITVSGSSAAYSYTKHSDIDLHILVDMEKFEDDDVYREFFDAKKVVYNEQHDIVINGHEVELYVQNTNDPVISLGEYSVLNDKWIKLPRKRRANLDQVSTRMKFEKIAKLAEYAIKSSNLEKITTVLKTIKRYRQAGLELHGEFGAENLAFKALRSKGIIERLYEKLNELHSRKLSIPESKMLDKPTMTVTQLANLHKVDRGHIEDQLQKGIKVEMEHTKQYDTAKEIALDHLKEDPNYYTKLSKANLEENIGNPKVDLTPNYPNYSVLVGEFMGINKNQRAVFKIISAELKLGQGATEKIEKSLATGKYVAIEMSRIRNRPVVGEGASGYIPSEKEKNDPRFKTALTVDVKPDTLKKNAKAFGFNISRAGIPPLLR